MAVPFDPSFHKIKQLIIVKQYSTVAKSSVCLSNSKYSLFRCQLCQRPAVWVSVHLYKQLLPKGLGWAGTNCLTGLLSYLGSYWLISLSCRFMGYSRHHLPSRPAQECLFFAVHLYKQLLPKGLGWAGTNCLTGLLSYLGSYWLISLSCRFMGYSRHHLPSRPAQECLFPTHPPLALCTFCYVSLS